MKLVNLVLTVLVFGSSSAFAAPCLKEAKLQARLFAAKENKVDVARIKVTDYFSTKDWRGVVYYGIALDNNEVVNVGLRKKDCHLSHINYVTDGL